MATYKTPGVYVEEISTLPKSVAAVETAIPAFIGYTERVIYRGKDLEFKPTPISSIVEFEALYGGAPPIAPTVTMNSATNTVTEVDLGANSFYLYESLRLFFDNGGGKCYIVAVGTYDDIIDIGTATTGLIGGLNTLEKVDEPTILLSPDAATLSATDLASFQQKALRQAAKLKDRIVVMDLNNSGDHTADVQTFRDGVGINSLKYGAAYTPWLNTSYPKKVRYRDLSLESSGNPISFRNLSKDTGVRDFIDSLLAPAITTVDSLTTAVIQKASLLNAKDSIEANFLDKVEALETAIAAPDVDDMKSGVEALLELNHNLIKEINTYYGTLPDPGADATATKYAFKLKPDTQTLAIDNNIDGLAQAHIHVINALNDAGVWTPGAIDTTGWSTATFKTKVDGILNSPAMDPVVTMTDAADAGVTAAYAALSSDAEIAEKALADVTAFFNAIMNWVSEIGGAAAEYESTFDNNLLEVSSTYKSILQEVSNALNDCPPSGAIAGVMASVDSTRGVWKAPANVSISGVINPVHQITNAEQDGLNVDPNAGKSINAIRAFTGKGTLVWGARTLAGNDNEWRYVSVRRLFNMVEESIQKSTSWAVFEPNDANTWVRLKGQIENFLVNLWRDGALQGATPQDAFFVNVGLGSTMTYQDILEGYLNIEIGMAAVRPAEFIVLKFSHKVVENA